MNKVESISIYNNHLDLVYYSYEILKKFPKSEKEVLSKNIREVLLDIYVNIINAYDENKIDEKIRILKKISTSIKVIEFYIRLSYKQKYISSQNYGAWSRKVLNVNKHLSNWITACQKRLK